MNIFKCAVFGSFIILQFGCLSIPDISMPFGNDDSNLNQEVTSKPEGTITNKNIVQAIDSMDEDKRLNELTVAMKEFENLKPQLYRMVALEEDLAYVMQHLSATSDLNDQVYVKTSDFQTYDGKSEEAFDSAEELIFDEAESPQFLDSELRKPESSSIGYQQPNQKSQIQVAPVPVDVNNLKQLANTKNVKPLGIDSKFSTNVSNTNYTNTQATKTKNSPSINETKFSNTQRPAQFPASINLKQTPALNRGQLQVTNSLDGHDFAIHLVSTSNTNALQKAWLDIQSEYPDIVFSKTPKSKRVIVNGKSYYSLRIGPFDEPSATNACTRVKNTKSYCGVVDYSGESFL